ncbi:MAG TPA: phospho-sugar mutase, partial [Phycisphaerae bacterium]|nr:phospho-sugar mutase [Phycisphaerae bacterium]
LREDAPRELAGVSVRSVGDLMTGAIVDRASGEKIDGYDLPKSDVIVLTLADESKVIARPSGTEPKIKFYILVREACADLPAAESAAAAKIARLEQEVQAIVDRILA